ncbi:cyclin PHO80-like protein, partial [Dimargaris cristalligena]
MSEISISRTPTKDVIKVLADFMQAVVTDNDVTNPQSSRFQEYKLHKVFTRQQDGHDNQTLTLFHSRGVPSIDLHSYLVRILKYCPCPNECFISLLIYFRRITEKCRRTHNPFSVDPYSVHRLTIAGITASSKYFSDLFYTNSRYARVGGVHVGELNMLELQFLKLLDFELFVTPEELDEVAGQLV